MPLYGHYIQVGEVRLRAVESLHYLYENSTFIPMLQLFTDRFKNRLVSMVMDKDDAVAVQAVKVCRLLLDSEMLNTVETEYVCSLVFVENRAVAQAATEFLLAKLFSQVRRKCELITVLVELVYSAFLY